MAYIDRLTVSRRLPSGLLSALCTRLALWHSRRALSKLDDRALEDIGVAPEAARREAAKGLWDVPQAWINR